MPENVPHLKEKLDRLFARDPLFGTTELLANRLGVKPPTIRQWIHLDGQVPSRHVSSLASIYDLKRAWLRLESLEEFDAVLEANPPGPGMPWQELLDEAEHSAGIRLATSGLRGLSSEPIETYRLGQPVYVEIDLTDLCPSPTSPCYVLVFIADSKKTECLFPSSGQSIERVKLNRLLLPREAPQKTFYVTAPRGPQQLIVLLTQFRFEDDLYVDLHRDENRDALARMACQLRQQARLDERQASATGQAAKRQWRLFARSHVVE